MLASSTMNKVFENILCDRIETSGRIEGVCVVVRGVRGVSAEEERRDVGFVERCHRSNIMFGRKVQAQ